MKRLLVVVALGALAAPSGGCEAPAQIAEGDLLIERRPDPVYEELFPYYVDLCAVSQYRSLDGVIGGSPGHAVMYLKGACKDAYAAWPRLRRCRREARDTADPEHGAGISVNRWLRNVNWLAVPSRDLFYKGRLEPGGRLTREHADETIRTVLAGGLLNGVRLHDDPQTGEEISVEEFMTVHSMGTDYALQYARSVFCSRMPVVPEMLDEVIEFLNELNDEYATGEADYEWSGLQDNCVHTLRNALAAASVWSQIPVQLIRIRQLFNLAIPANQFVNLALLGAEGPVADFWELDRDPAQREALLEFGWLPTRHGALVKTLPIHENNDLFDTTFRLFVLQSPLRRGQTTAALRLLSDERFEDLEANLHHFAGLYDQILSERDEEEAFGIASLRGDRYRRARRRYYAYVEAQRAEVDAMLASIQHRAEGEADSSGG